MALPEYQQWQEQQTPENMAKILEHMAPVINSEIQRFPGPKPLLRSKARALTVKAVRSYDPNSGAQLHSWVVTQLQPLSRYGQQLRPIHAPEVAIRQAAEVNRHRQELNESMGREPTDLELADKVGISQKRIRDIRDMVRHSAAEGSLVPQGEESADLPVVSTTNQLPVVEEAVYSALGPRDQAIFDWKTGRNGKPELSNQEIARRLGVTPALISQRSQTIAQQIADISRKNIL